MTVKSMKDEGDSLYKASDFQGAITAYSRAINNTTESDPEMYVCYSNRCACYLQIADYHSALKDAENCVRIKPQWPKGYNRKGSCLVHLKKKNEAILAYERAVELDSSNIEAINALSKLRNTTTSNSHQNSTEASPNILNTLKVKCTQLYQQFLTTDWSTIFSNLTAFMSVLYYQCQSYWHRLHPDTRKYLTIGVGCLLVYYFFFYRSSQNYYPDDYHYSSGYGGSYYGGGGGLSWSMWAAIMFGAYKIPPMFPDIFGDYARPFFGMSWTTFMWLLNMLTNNRGGGRFGGYGGYGGLGGRRGGMFGRRY